MPFDAAQINRPYRLLRAQRLRDDLELAPMLLSICTRGEGGVIVPSFREHRIRRDPVHRIGGYPFAAHEDFDDSLTQLSAGIAAEAQTADLNHAADLHSRVIGKYILDGLLDNLDDLPSCEAHGDNPRLMWDEIAQSGDPDGSFRYCDTISHSGQEGDVGASAVAHQIRKQ